MIMNLYMLRVQFCMYYRSNYGRMKSYKSLSVMYADAVNAVLLCRQLWAFG